MSFGLSFGSNKSKSTTTTNVDKTETGTEASSGVKATEGTTTQTGSTTTTQQGSTTNTGTTTGSTTGTQSTTGTTQQFSDSTLSGLESAVSQLLGAVPTTTPKLAEDFNRDQFIQSGMDAASSQIQGQLEQSLNSMFDQFGGRDDSNSMAMLLANRARGDAGAALSGAYSNLMSQGEQIQRENFNANLAGNAQMQGFLQTALDALKGGRATTTGQTQTAEQTAGTSTQAGTSQQTGTENTQQQTVQSLLELLANITAGTTRTTGTESSTTKGKTSGGGFGLSL